MKNYVQVNIPEKLYNVVLEICKLEPGVKTDRMLPEDLIERKLAVGLRETLEHYFYDLEARDMTEAARDAMWNYHKDLMSIFHEHMEEEEMKLKVKFMYLVDRNEENSGIELLEEISQKIKEMAHLEKSPKWSIEVVKEKKEKH